MADGLDKTVVDVALGVLDQTPSDTQGPLGRLTSLINAQVRNYTPRVVGTTGTAPAQVQVDPRDAFVSFTQLARSIIDGSSTFVDWSNPQVLAPLGDQLVSVAGNMPRVYNGTTFTTYPNNTVVPNVLSQSVFHTSQRVIQAPDYAICGSTRCSVWTETVATAAGPVNSTWIGFKSSTGAWLVQPTVLLGWQAAGVVLTAKVVSDGTQFFVVYNDTANIRYGVSAYDTNGALLATTTIAATDSNVVKPGHWDVVAATTTGGNAGTAILAQALSTSSNAGVEFVSLGLSGSSITHHLFDDTSLQCGGPVSWLKNKTGNGLAYLTAAKSLGGWRLFAYEISNIRQVHEFDTAISISTNSLDSVTGYAVAGTDGIDVVLSVGVLPDITAPATSGPPVDPGFRSLTSVSCDRSNVATTLRSTNSLAQVTRAFDIDGIYHVVGYYQSGSGLVVTPQSQTVTVTDGDYMVGAPEQDIAVVSGDQAAGSPLLANNITTAGNTVNVTPSETSRNIISGDKALLVGSVGNAPYGIPDGTPLLQWSLVNLGSGGAQWAGSRLVVSGASALNSTFDIVQGAGSFIYTPAFDIFGNPVSAATFTTAGTFVVQSMTVYYLTDLSAAIDTNAVATFFTSGGHLTIAGAGHSGNNGTFLIKRVSTASGNTPATAGNPTYDFGLLGGTFVWVQTTTQSTNADTYTATVTPNTANHWYFRNGKFDNTYIGANLVVSSDVAVPANVQTWPITASDSIGTVTTGTATGTLPQIFDYPLPDISIQLTTQIAYSFKFQSLTLDYTYQNALVSVQGAVASQNNGVYQITQINADGTFIATPTSGTTNQVNEGFFAAGGQTITIFFANNIQPIVQPCWFLVPLTGQQPVTGRIDFGSAYADWRVEGDLTVGPTLFPMCLSSPAVTEDGLEFLLPYRAQSVTQSQPLLTVAGQLPITEAIEANTVGLKVFTISETSGQAFSNGSELLLPGPMAQTFTASGFRESGINLSLEAPFLVSQSVAADAAQLALTPGAKYFYVACAEATNDNGDRIFSPPSAALEVDMALSNNVNVIGGRMLFPLNSSGQPIANTFGPTSWQVTISLYRTAWVNGVPTATQHYKITNDLNVNGLAPMSTLNPSGFSFPDAYTWNFLDQVPDSGLTASEILYTDKALLPRYPAPPTRQGIGSLKNRDFLVDDSARVWMSGEKTAGDASWYHPALTWQFSTLDRPLAVAALEDYLLVLCEKSLSYIPLAGEPLPDATGSNGGLPTPVPLRFPNGSKNGFAMTFRNGVIYDSTAGGLWEITPTLGNEWQSHPVLDSLASDVTGLALDKNQRLFVQQSGSSQLLVYDGVPGAWYTWQMATTPKLLTSYMGQAAYQDTATVNVVTTGAVADSINGTVYPFAPDLTVAPFGFANIRGAKRVWEFQIVGKYRGPHRQNVVLSYPQDDNPDDVFDPVIPDPSKPYIIPFNPTFERASQFGVRIYGDFVGVSEPGASFSIELISAEVGLEPGGLNKRPNSSRATTKK
jgi:hypothetical protein